MQMIKYKSGFLDFDNCGIKNERAWASEKSEEDNFTEMIVKYFLRIEKYFFSKESVTKIKMSVVLKNDFGSFTRAFTDTSKPMPSSSPVVTSKLDLFCRFITSNF